MKRLAIDQIRRSLYPLQKDDRAFAAKTVIWTAGVTPSRAGKWAVHLQFLAPRQLVPLFATMTPFGW